jgi:hypothetical protein
MAGILSERTKLILNNGNNKKKLILYFRLNNFLSRGIIFGYK